MSAKKQSIFKLAFLLSLGLVLGLGISACGGKKSMEGAGEEEQVGTVNEPVTHLAGEDEGVAQANFDQVEKARRLAALPSGSTASHPGKKNKVTVKAGDTLWKIAERKDVYGSGWLYPLIYKANKSVIKNPNRLDAGITLIVPRDVPKVDEEIAKEEAMTGQILDTSPLPGQEKKVEVKVATKAVRKASSSHWLWYLLIILVIVGAVLWRRMKLNERAEEAEQAEKAEQAVPPTA